jgi:hypothetical protein
VHYDDGCAPPTDIPVSATLQCGPPTCPGLSCTPSASGCSCNTVTCSDGSTFTAHCDVRDPSTGAVPCTCTFAGVTGATFFQDASCVMDQSLCQ